MRISSLTHPNVQRLVAAKSANFFCQLQINDQRQLRFYMVDKFKSAREFEFSGSMTSQFRQVGNAVPPLLAKRLGESVLKSIKQNKKLS
jgi:site-specific DNA-cytosine methylase